MLKTAAACLGLLVLCAARTHAQGFAENILGPLASSGDTLWVGGRDSGLFQMVRSSFGLSDPSPISGAEDLRLLDEASPWPAFRTASTRHGPVFPAVRISGGFIRFAGLLRPGPAGAALRTFPFTGPAAPPFPRRLAVRGDTLFGAAQGQGLVAWPLIAPASDTLLVTGLRRTGGPAVVVSRCGTCDLAADLRRVRQTADTTLQDTLLAVTDVAVRDDTLAVATPRGLWWRVDGIWQSGPAVPGDTVLGIWAGPDGWWISSGRGLLWSPGLFDSLQSVRDSRIDLGRWRADSGLEVASMTFRADTAFAVVHGSQRGRPALVRLRAGAPVNDGLSWWLGPEEGLPLPEDAEIAEVLAVPPGAADALIAVSTLGQGLLSSTDGGRTWRIQRRQASLRGGLEEVRIAPTALRLGSALIGYRLASDSRVDIEVFNGGMERVRSIVRGADRQGGVRSEDPVADRWDGCTDGGRLAPVGLYYVRVRAGGEVGWGKVFQLKREGSCAP